MAKKEKPLIKLNKNHNGKEFKSFFHFVGKVSPVYKYEDNQRVLQDYFEESTVGNGNQMRKLQFIVQTALGNELKVELAGFKQDWAYTYSQTEGKSKSIKWDDRFDKSKYPNDTYHLIDTDWDKAEKFAEMIQDDVWVEVKGHYGFDSFTDSQKGRVNFRRRTIDSVEIVEDGQQIKAGKTVILDKYVADFESEEFKEINFIDMQIGINSTYREDGELDTKINAYFLDYGKERSTPHQTDLIVPYVEPEEGKSSLADSFLKLNKYDFVEVQGTDNNRAIFGEVETEEKEIDDDPFANLDEQGKTTKKRNAVVGTDKGIKVTSIVAGTYRRELLTEEEVKEIVKQKENPFEQNEQQEQKEKDPFSNVDDDPFA